MSTGRRWLAYILSLLIGVQVVSFAFACAQMGQVERLIFAEAGMDQRVYEVDFVDREIKTYMDGLDGRAYGLQSTALSRVDVLRLRTCGALAMLPLWRDSYINASVSDAKMWRVSIISDGKAREIMGMGDWPLTWRLLIPKMTRMADTSMQNALPISPDIPLMEL